MSLEAQPHPLLQRKHLYTSPSPTEETFIYLTLSYRGNIYIPHPLLQRKHLYTSPSATEETFIYLTLSYRGNIYIPHPLLNIIQRYYFSCFSNEMKSKKYNTVETVLKSNRKTKIQHRWNSSKI
jgi:hypothetical protein